MQSIDRAIAILDMLSRHENGMAISDISSVSNLPLGTTHRFLKSLMHNGMVVQDPGTKYYKLGLHILNMATNLLNSNRLIEVSKRHTARVALALGHLVYVCQEHDDEVVCVDCAAHSNNTTARFYVRIGSIMPFHASASAKAIFACHPPALLQRLMTKHAPLYRYTAKTKCTLQEVLEDYALCRQQGYAVCDEEMEPGVHAVAAPIFSYDRKAVGSVVIIAIKTDEARMRDMIDEVVACARDISRDMGFVP